MKPRILTKILKNTREVGPEFDDIIAAAKSGKHIQFLVDDGQWVDNDSLYLTQPRERYRVKPDPEPTPAITPRPAKTEPLRPSPPAAYRRKTTNRPPLRMSTLHLPEDLHKGLAGIALSIFTDMVNDGKTFQDALLAVYLSGLQHGTVGGGNNPE